MVPSYKMRFAIGPPNKCGGLADASSVVYQ